MTSNEIQNVWNSPLNNLSAHQQTQLAEKFISQMNRRRRFQSFWLTYTFAWLSIITAIAFWSIAIGKTKLAHEWALLPLLIVPWAVAVYFLRDHLKSTTARAQDGLSVVETLRAALAANLNRQTGLKIVGGLYVVFIPFLVLVMRQLHAAGKISERELFSMTVLFGGALLVSALVMSAFFFKRLLPQQRRLKGLLAEAIN